MSAAAPATKSKGKTIGIAVGALLAVVALVGALVMLIRPSSSEKPNEDPTETATTETTGANAPTEEAPASETPAQQSGEDVFNALPESLGKEVGTCNRRTSTFNSLTGTQISCEVKFNGDNVQYFKPTGPYDAPRITFAYNTEDGSREKALIEQGRYTDKSDAEPVTTDNAAAIATKDNDTSATLHYANAETGLVIESRDFASPEKAIEWLEHHNLL